MLRLAGIIQRTESKLTRTVILKKSVLSASTVPFTVMLPVLRSMANNPSSLPESERKKKNKLESYPLVRILKSTYFARWFDTLKSITCSVSLTWPNGVSISLNILELDQYIINYLSWRFKNLTDWRMEKKMRWSTSHQIIAAHVSFLFLSCCDLTYH